MPFSIYAWLYEFTYRHLLAITQECQPYTSAWLKTLTMRMLWQIWNASTFSCRALPTSAHCTCVLPFSPIALLNPVSRPCNQPKVRQFCDHWEIGNSNSIAAVIGGILVWHPESESDRQNCTMHAQHLYGGIIAICLSFPPESRLSTQQTAVQRLSCTAV